MAKQKSMTMSQDIRGWGVGLLIMAILHFVLPFLSAEWGMVLIPLGILSLIIRHRGMFIVIGAGLIMVGLLNIAGSIDAGGGFWTIFGGLQIYWGIKEMAKFSRYGREPEGTLSADREALD